MLDSLLNKFKEEFQGVKQSVLKNVLVLTVCILERETVNINKLKKQVGIVLGNTTSKPQAHYTRLIRLFKREKQSQLWQQLLLFCVRLFRLRADYLLLDGTSWEFGQEQIHLLVLSMVYKGVAIPICWHNLEKKGISSVEERKALLDKAAELYQLKGKTLIADREYIGIEWFEYLQAAGIHFVVRLRKDLYRKAVDQVPGCSYSKLERKAARGKRAVGKRIALARMQLTVVVVAKRQANAGEPLLYLLSDLACPAFIAQTYRLRWLIEYCFKHMKSNGFELEQLGFKDKDKIRLLLAVVVLAYCLAIHEGLSYPKTGKPRTYKNQTAYPAVSLFRQGLDCLAPKVYQLVLFLQYLFQHCLQSKKRYISPKAIFV